MFGKGSPKISLMQVATMQRKSSPTTGGKRKKRSPKAKCARANWNPGLEKGLVQILHDHDNDCYRGQNGWSSETWNRMVQKFHEQFPYVQFTKDQIQDKEKELKRDFKVLKEARKQSGVHWDDKLCMIKAERPIWDNIIMSHPKASKFQRQGFPLYDDLEKLYEGKTAEGNFSFISLKPKDDDVRILEKDTHDGVGSLAFISGYNNDPENDDIDDDDDVREVPPQMFAATTSRMDASVSSRSKRSNERDEESAASAAKGAKVAPKRKNNADLIDLMRTYVELKTVQTKREVAEDERARTKAEASDFSIKNCNALLATMEELSSEDRADAYDVFMDVQNREIFMTADPSSRLIWLKKKMRLLNSSS